MPVETTPTDLQAALQVVAEGATEHNPYEPFIRRARAAEQRDPADDEFPTSYADLVDLVAVDAYGVARDAGPVGATMADLRHGVDGWSSDVDHILSGALCVLAAAGVVGFGRGRWQVLERWSQGDTVAACPANQAQVDRLRVWVNLMEWRLAGGFGAAASTPTGGSA